MIFYNQEGRKGSLPKLKERKVKMEFRTYIVTGLIKVVIIAAFLGLGVAGVASLVDTENLQALIELGER